MTHTPSPWKVRRNQSTNKPSCEITTQDKTSICYMSKGDAGLNDAHLISAAPELLEQLKYLVALEEATAGECGEEETPHLDAARAAIAKAEGAA
jgi:hypothetical protein